MEPQKVLTVECQQAEHVDDRCVLSCSLSVLDDDGQEMELYSQREDVANALAELAGEEVVVRVSWR